MHHFKWRMAFLCLLNLGLITGCASDNEEDLYANPGTCDTSAVTFSGTMNAILENRGCKGCHGAASPSGGVILDSFAEVQKRANSGQLMGAITHAPGFTPMPFGGTKISDCEIASIKKWIDNGTPNN
ncbi:hypothetical protein [Adhaeribacter radiodurans]|uniref:Cytochrome c domain-containing protein n=1 Tax=Adhaeribacter radiodurans TaxID=2745197 RepID=A0A7L7L8K4_9BACT|nr:hypothetical protein [Adhaeribacter radiodurans]QMU28865.1 hypothetical protein HUW48_12820 [Adhaeribacter radiodurans]